MDTATFVAPFCLAWACCGNAAVAATGDASAGRETFNSACVRCHQVGPSARAAFGPPLNDLFGRPAGTVPGYRYSAAMKKARIIWTDQTLTAFIKDPQRAVPDTTMRFYPIGYDERRIADLLAYLRLQRARTAHTP